MVVYHYLFDVSRISIGTHVLPQCIAYATHCVLMCYPFNTVQLSRCNLLCYAELIAPDITTR